MKLIYKYLKRIVLGGLLLYSYNIIAVNFNMIIPINIWTLLFTSFFDFLGIVALVIIKVWGV